MIYKDTLYGNVAIDEPLLLELIHSRAMQRLHGVLQHGVTALIGLTSPVTRFDHSLGVMLLVRRLGGDLHEQVAALLHDVSHTAFSHVIDYVVQDHDGQSYHDRHKASFLAGTDVPQILARHGYAWPIFLDESRYPILEQPAPRLCADRLDYFFRDSIDLGLAEPEDVQQALDRLAVVDGRIAATDLHTARWLAQTYIAADDASWSNFREVGLYELAARAIRRALALGLLTEPDLWGTDRVLWRRLREHDDPELQHWLQLVSPATSFAWDTQQPTFLVSTKIRTIDPDVLQDGRLLPLSRLDPPFAASRRAYLRRKSGSWPMRVIPPAHLAVRS